MANHAVAHGELTVKRVIFPEPSQGNKMSTKPTGNRLWELRARQFQRLYHAVPKHKNRHLITAEHLARAKLLQPDYALPAAVEGDENDEEDDNDDETTQEEAWPEAWDNIKSLTGVLSHRTWKSYPIRKETEDPNIGSKKVQKPAPKPAPKPAQNPPSGSTSAQPASPEPEPEPENSFEAPLDDSPEPETNSVALLDDPPEPEINSEVPLNASPEPDRRPPPTQATVLLDNHHVSNRPQQPDTQADPSGLLLRDPAYPSLAVDPRPVRPRPELQRRFQEVRRGLERLIVNAQGPRNDAELIGHEGSFGSRAFSQNAQSCHSPAEPIGNRGSSRWNTFSQDASYDDAAPIVNEVSFGPGAFLKDARNSHNAAYPIRNEGSSGSQGFSQVPQRSHHDADPSGNEGSSGSRAFSQDDFRMFLAWRRERRRPGAGGNS